MPPDPIDGDQSVANPAHGGQPGRHLTQVDMRVPVRDPAEAKAEQQRRQLAHDLGHQPLTLPRERWTRTTIGDLDEARFQARRFNKLRERDNRRCVVCPGGMVVAEDGRRLHEGDEVRIGVDVTPAQARFLADREVVHTFDGEEYARRRSRPEHTHRVVCERITTRNRSLLYKGWTCSAADWADPGEPDLETIEEWKFVRGMEGLIRSGRPAPEVLVRWPGRPGRPADDGTARIAELVVSGAIEPLTADESAAIRGDDPSVPKTLLGRAVDALSGKQRASARAK